MALTTARKKFDPIGLQFGRLTVVKMAGVTRFGKTQNPERNWDCICECGRWTVVPSRHLRRGATISCGCWARELQMGVFHRTSRESSQAVLVI